MIKLEDCAIFNYRLRQVIENAFGILAARWRIFQRPIIAHPDRVILYAQAAIALHNYLRTDESSVYCPPGFVDCEDGCRNIIEGGWRQDEDGNTGMLSISHTGSNRLRNRIYHMFNQNFAARYSRTAGEARDMFKEYFCLRASQVEWQYQHVRQTN